MRQARNLPARAPALVIRPLPCCERGSGDLGHIASMRTFILMARETSEPTRGPILRCRTRSQALALCRGAGLLRRHLPRPRLGLTMNDAAPIDGNPSLSTVPPLSAPGFAVGVALLCAGVDGASGTASAFFLGAREPEADSVLLARKHAHAPEATFIRTSS